MADENMKNIEEVKISKKSIESTHNIDKKQTNNGYKGLESIFNLTHDELLKAVVLSEVLGKPVSKKR